MSDNFVTCRHCGVGINYACDHEDTDVPQEDVESLAKAAKGLRRFVRHNERCCVWNIGAPTCNCGLAVVLEALDSALSSPAPAPTTHAKVKP